MVTAHKDLNIVCWDIEQGMPCGRFKRDLYDLNVVMAFILWPNWSMVKSGILIGFLNRVYFATRTADLTDLCS